MATWRDVGVNYGGQHIGKGISRLIKEVDKYMGKEAAPVQERPSTWIIAIGSIGLPAAAIFLRLRDPWDKLAILAGGYLSTGLWDIIEEAMASLGVGGAATAAFAQPPIQVTPHLQVTTQTTSRMEKIY